VNHTAFLYTSTLTFQVDALELESPTMIQKLFTTIIPSTSPTISVSSFNNINVGGPIFTDVTINNIESFALFGLLEVSGDRVESWSSNTLLAPGMNTIPVTLNGLSGGSTDIIISFKFGSNILSFETFETQVSDSLPPQIEVLEIPGELSKEDRYTISANVTDHSEISSVQVFISTDNGATYSEKQMGITVSQLYAAILGPFEVPEVKVYVKATDIFGNEQTTNIVSILITEFQTEVSTTTTTTTNSQSTSFSIWFGLLYLIIGYPIIRRRQRRK
jgi:hypothetical protein